GSGKATFTGTADGSEFYALYPYDSEATISEGVITLSLPSAQTGVEGTFGPGLNKSVAYTDNGELNMKNIFGLIQFTLTRTDITSVTISSAGREYLTGKVQVSLDGSGIPSYSVVNGTRYVTVFPSGSTFAAGTYYAVVLPQTYDGGLVMTFTTDTKAAVRRKTADAVVSRSHILGAGTPDASLTLNNIINLGSTETANCYVAGAAGRRYKMPVTVMGNGYTTPEDTGYTTPLQGASPGITPSALSPESAQLLWQTSADLINDVTYDDGYVYFTLNGTVGGALTQGNASIAVYSGDHASGDILWSWHIWVTDANLDALVQTWTIHDDYDEYSNYVDPILMDRNLGALSNQPWGTTSSHAAHGLFYQWGRKDPFPGADDSSISSTTPITTYDAGGSTVPGTTADKLAGNSNAVQWGYVSGAITDRDADGAKYPMNFRSVGSGQWLVPPTIKAYHDLWGLPLYPASSNYIGHKTIYDPCPPGYRVSNPYAMSGVVPDNSAGGNINTTYPDNNIANFSTSRTDGGYWVKYDGVNQTWLPYTGQLPNTTSGTKYYAGKLYRVGNYGGYYWSSKPGDGGSSYRGAGYQMDYNNFYSIQQTSAACFGFAVRCEKIK
ncbi:MAG: hypothetical protein IJS07_08660, partial [Bacteroidales bacterium]|nr:hypothetical protein [Bacteroidales bacterium]